MGQLVTLSCRLLLAQFVLPKVGVAIQFMKMYVVNDAIHLCMNERSLRVFFLRSSISALLFNYFVFIVLMERCLRDEIGFQMLTSLYFRLSSRQT